LSGRLDSALHVAMQISEVYDSALVRQKRSESAELATIYDTQGKERKILEQRAENRLVTAISIAVTILALLILAFAVYIFSQWRFTKRKNRVLVDQINEALEYKMKYRESEKRKVNSEKFATATSSADGNPEGNSSLFTIHSSLNESLSISDMTELSDEQLFLCLRDLIENEQLFLKPDFGRQTLIEHTGLSKERIGAAFAQGSDSVSLPAYVRELRLDYAVRMMNDQPDIAVELVSQASGFTNADTFTRNFRAKFGMTPTTYKQTLNSEK
jgi:AraC-like DNA-binding protein